MNAASPAMSSSDFCSLCRGSGNACPHIITDLNRALPVFADPAHNGAEDLHEFQFFGNDDSLAWLFNDPKPATVPQRPEKQPAAAVAPAFNYMDGFRSSCNPGRLTFDVCFSGTSSADSMRRSPSALEVPSAFGQVATSNNVVSGFIHIYLLGLRRFYIFYGLIINLYILILISRVIYAIFVCI